MKPLSILTIAAATAILVSSCKRNEISNEPLTESLSKNLLFPAAELQAYSVTPSLVVPIDKNSSLKIYPLISSEDTLEGSPNFLYGAQPDGGGFIKDPNSNGFIMVNNHEINQSVSRVYLDKYLKPIKGEYIVNFTGGAKRLCSATMATQAEHGFGPLFLTAQESGAESMVVGVDPLGLASDAFRTDRVLPALGKCSMENAVPLPLKAYPGKTLIFMGEDQSYDATNFSAGQLIMYKSDVVGDLQNGKLYALKRTNNDQVEMNMVKGSSYDVEFVEIPDAKNSTGAQINALVNDAKAIRFSRVEDVDYRKGSAENNREIFFTATGQTATEGYTMWGRVYHLTLNDADPTKGTLEVIAEGDSNPGNDIINPDNVCATEDFLYIQEDGDSFYPAAKHDSYIWQYNLGNKTYKPWLTMNHRRDDAEWNAKFNTANNNKLGSWEYGAMIDISDIIGLPNTFLLNIHPHTWRNAAFVNPDGGGSTSQEGGQTLIIRGVQR